MPIDLQNADQASQVSEHTSAAPQNSLSKAIRADTGEAVRTAQANTEALVAKKVYDAILEDKAVYKLAEAYNLEDGTVLPAGTTIIFKGFKFGKCGLRYKLENTETIISTGMIDMREVSRIKVAK